MNPPTNKKSKKLKLRSSIFSIWEGSHKVDETYFVDKRYKLEKIIGVGSFGEIFEGTDFKTKKKVAIKFEKPDAKKKVLNKVYKLLEIMTFEPYYSIFVTPKKLRKALVKIKA